MLDIDETHCCYKSSMIPVHVTCVRTVSEPLRMKVLEICFERKADSPSCGFSGKLSEKGERLDRAFVRPRQESRGRSSVG